MEEDFFLTLKGNCGNTIFEACDLQDYGMCLEREARIIRKEILRKPVKKKLSNKNYVISKKTFTSQSEINSISPPVICFINMKLIGSNVDTSDEKSPSALTIAQLLQSNTIKQKNKSRSNETLLPLYTSLMVHSRTTRKVLQRNLTNMGQVYLTNAFLKYKIVSLTSCENYTMFRNLYALQHLDDEEMLHRCNWASFCASQVQNLESKCLSAMLPLLQDEIATHGMVRHTMDIIDQVHEKTYT